MSSLKERLLSAERDAVSALVHGNEALVAFYDTWERLVEDVDAACRNNSLDDDVRVLVHVTATRIATLADVSAEAYASCESFTVDLVDQLQAVMSELTLLDSSVSTQISVRTPAETSTIPTARSSAPTRKRQRMPSSEYDDAAPFFKRCRITTESLASKPECQTDSADSACQLSSSPSSHVPAKPLHPSCVTPKRKRRVSESEPADSVPPCKRRYIGPRLHAVSDSFIAPRSDGRKTQATATFLPHPDFDLDRSPVDWLVDAAPEQSPKLPSSDPINPSSSTNSAGSEVYDAAPNLDGVPLSLPGLDSLDAFLETIFLPHDSTVVPTSLSEHSTSSLPSPSLRGSSTSSCSSDSDSGSSPASSTPSTPRSSPTTPSLDTDILKFDLGASQYFTSNDEWALGDELQFSSFYDIVPPLPEAKWPSSPIGSSWLDVSRLVSPSLDEDLDTLL